MLEFRRKLFLTTALASTICYTAAKASDAPATTESSAAAENSSKVTESSAKGAPVPGNLPQSNLLHIFGKLNGADEDDEKIVLFPKESDEAIKKANELHAQALEQFKRNNMEQAIKLDEDACRVAPHYWLPHVALAYLYSNYKGGGPALEQATMGIKCEHPAMADTTHAALIASMRAFGSAMDKYKELVAANPTSWRAKVGLASCYMNKGDSKAANAILDELSNSQLKDPAALLMMGNYYKKTGEIAKAKEVLRRGLDNDPEPKIKEKLLVQLFEIAVNSNDSALIVELKPRVSSILDAKQRAWLRIANIKLAKTPVDAKLALQLAESETVTDTEYRMYANIFSKLASENPSEQTAWLKLSKEALSRAFTDHPASLQNKALLASVDEQLGDKQAALAVMKTTSERTQTEEDSDEYMAGYYKKMHKAQDDALAKLIIADKDGYKCFAEAAEFKIPQANCRCKINSAKSIMKTLPGVFDVVVGPGDIPTATIIFDKRKITREAIFDNPKIKNFKEKFQLGDERPVTSVIEMAKIYSGEEQNPIAQSPSVQLVMLQYPTVQDAVTAVSVGSNSQSN